MASTLRFTDGRTTHHLRIETPQRTERGDYTVRIFSGDDDTEGHMLSVATAVDAFMKVSARDARAMRVEIHEAANRRWFESSPESPDDVSGHAAQEHEWEMSAEAEEEVEGHDASKAVAANIAFGAATAFVAMRSSDHQHVHRAALK